MLDIQKVRDEAFQYMHQLPKFCSDVVLLVEELENTREEVSIKNGMLDDDAKIIHGLVKHYKLLESVAVVGKRYREGQATDDDFDAAWHEFEDSLFSPARSTTD